MSFTPRYMQEAEFVGLMRLVIQTAENDNHTLHFNIEGTTQDRHKLDRLTTLLPALFADPRKHEGSVDTWPSNQEADTCRVRERVSGHRP